MMNINPWPFYDANSRNIVENILKRGSVNYLFGEEGKLFEKEFSKFIGVKYAVCFSNGSTSLYSAYKVLGIGPGDEVITTPRTFIATSSAIILVGAKPVFADVDINSGCITAQSIEPLITKKTKAISVVHLGGYPAQLDEISKLAKAYNLLLVEDCAQAHGASFNGKNVGSYGDVSSWSFCTDKIMSTCGEGGILTTNSQEIYEKLWSFKDHGKSFKKFYSIKDNSEFVFLHDDFGFNFRMTELQSAIGRYQLKCLKDWNRRRVKNATILSNQLSGLSPIRIPKYSESINHAYYKFYCYLNPKYLKTNWDRKRIINEIRNSGYPAFVGSCSEIYLEKSFKDYGLSPDKRLPNARELGETSLMFLVHNTITEKQMIKYSEEVKNVIINSKT